MQYVGVDGCKGGWFAVWLDGDAAGFSLHDDFAGVWANYKEAQCLFVDMPIGLASSGTREADVAARRFLPSRIKSTIFNTPVREAVYAPTKAEAKSISQKLSGKSLSEQSLSIMRKIVEIDRVLQTQSESRRKVFESHPEICFGQLGGRFPAFGKKDFLGALERLRILRNFVPDVEEILVSARNMHIRSKVEGDDMLDAFVLALTARECEGKASFFPSGLLQPPQDETGLPMAIWYHENTTAT